MYHAALLKMLVAASPNPGEWPWLADLSTMLDALGTHLSIMGQFLIRASAALIMLGIAMRARAVNFPSVSFVVSALGLTYLTVFNPRNEADSFVAIAPIVGISAGLLLAGNLRAISGWFLLAAAVALGVRWGRSIDAWLKPGLALTYFGFVAAAVIWRRHVPWLAVIDLTQPAKHRPKEIPAVAD